MDPLLFLVTGRALSFFKPEPIEVIDESSPTGGIVFAYVPHANDVPVICFSTKPLLVHDIWYAMMSVKTGQEGLCHPNLVNKKVGYIALFPRVDQTTICHRSLSMAQDLTVPMSYYAKRLGGQS